MSYDFSSKTFSEFLKINNLNLQDAVVAVVEEYSKLKNEIKKLEKTKI